MKSKVKIFTVWFFTVLFVYPVGAQMQRNEGFREPSLSTQGSWSVIMLPDPQTYVKFDYNQPLLELLTAWMVRYKEKLNIQMTLCTGDMVEQNDYLNPDGRNGNQPSKSQWESAARAFCRLDGKIPYVLATGNHDFGFVSAENRQTNYDRYFPVDKNWLNQKLLRDVGIGGDNRPSLTNATYEFISPQGKKFLILVLEFAPRDEILDWAKKVVAQEKYAQHTVILLTHSYLDAENRHINEEGYRLPGPNFGAAIWQKLVQPSKNILMVLSGHIGEEHDAKAHLAFRTDVNVAGKKVQQMTFNAQALGGGWHGNGGDGWLRILEFLPDGKTIKVKTFSPLFAMSPTTQQYAWRTEPYDEFTFTLDELVDKPRELIVCGDDKVLVIDEDASKGDDVKVVWRWKVSDIKSQLPEAYQEYLRGVDDCKSVDGGKNILITAGRGVALIERATGKCLFYACTPNSHSAEVLPGGRIVVALSITEGGNSLQLYDRDKPEKVLFRDSLYSGHGTVWNEKRQRLYVLGFDELREYSLVNWDSSSPALKMEKKWKIPGRDGHDLSRVSDDELLITEHDGVHSFNIANETFSPFKLLINAKNIKSVNYIKESGRLIYTQAEESWWTFNVYLRNPDKTIHIPDIKVYKVRVAY